MVKTHVILRLLNNLEGYVNELRYDKVDPEQVYAIFRNDLGTFDSFRHRIEGWLDREIELR